MSRVWKVGSRWSECGDPRTSVVDVFKHYNVVFTYTKQTLDVAPDDLVALADGYDIIALGKIISNPLKIKEMDIAFSEEDKKKPFYDDAVCGCRVQFLCWLDRKTNLYYWSNHETAQGPIKYKKRGQFCHAPAIEKDVNLLFKKYAGDNQ